MLPWEQTIRVFDMSWHNFKKRWIPICNLENEPDEPTSKQGRREHPGGGARMRKALCQQLPGKFKIQQKAGEARVWKAGHVGEAKTRRRARTEVMVNFMWPSLYQGVPHPVNTGLCGCFWKKLVAGWVRRMALPNAGAIGQFLKGLKRTKGREGVEFTLPDWGVGTSIFSCPWCSWFSGF